MISAFLFYYNFFFAGALALLGAIVIDCADGMVARATGQTSPTGRIFDGFIDTIWISSVWYGILFSGRFSYSLSEVLWLMFFAAISMFIHVWVYDGIKNTYLAICEPRFSEKNMTKNQVMQALRQSLKERHYWNAFLYSLLTWHAASFGKGAEKRYDLSEDGRERARQRLFLPMWLCGFLGEGTHLGLMFVAGLFSAVYRDAMLVAFVTILIPLNILQVPVAILWFSRKHELIHHLPTPVRRA